MASSLGQLFQQIIDSEQKTQEKKDYINKLKSDYVKCLENIKAVEQKLAFVEGELTMKTKEFISKSVERNWLSNKVTILKKENDKQLRKQNDTELTMTKLLSQIREAEEAFCDGVKEFSSGYDICSSGHLQREQKARDKLQKLTEEEVALTEEISSLKLQEEQLRTLQEQRTDWQKQIALSKRKLKKLDTDLDIEKQKVKELQQEKQRVSKVPHTDSEFKRLHAELEACKEESMESLCLALQQELQELKQKLWQKDLQMKRELQQQQRLAYSTVKSKVKPVSSTQTKSGRNSLEAEDETVKKRGEQQTGNKVSSRSSRTTPIKDPQNIQRFSNFRPASSFVKPAQSEKNNHRNIQSAAISNPGRSCSSNQNSEDISDAFIMSEELDRDQFSSNEQFGMQGNNVSFVSNQHKPNLGKLRSEIRKRKNMQPKTCEPNYCVNMEEKLSWKQHQERMADINIPDSRRTPKNAGTTKRFLFNKSSAQKMDSMTTHSSIPSASMFAACSQEDSQTDM